MKIRYEPEIYHVELHSNTDKEPMASAVCFSFFFRQTQITARTESFSDILGVNCCWIKTHHNEINQSDYGSCTRTQLWSAELTQRAAAVLQGILLLPFLVRPFSCPSACFSSVKFWMPFQSSFGAEIFKRIRWFSKMEVPVRGRAIPDNTPEMYPILKQWMSGCKRF